MPTLTKENAKHHCRTCLKQLDASCGATSPNEIPLAAECEEDIAENKDIYINIKANTELQALIRKFIDGRIQDDEDVQYFPQNLCLGCYNKLQSFEKFQKRVKESDQKLNAVMKSGVTKVELDYGSDHNDEFINNDDIYRLLLKDTLMETESVLLDNTSAATLVNSEIQDPDPFGATAATPKPSRKTAEDDDADSDGQQGYDWQKSANEDESSGDDNSSNSSTDSSTTESDSEDVSKREAKPKRKVKKNENNDIKEEEEEETNAKTTRLRSRKIHATPSQPEKKKRRTKKEMEEFRRMQKEKLENKIKRRNKGTKNSFKCEQCNHCFAHKITLDAHVRKVHEGSKRPFQCDRCDKSYTFIGGLYTHIKEIHETQVRSYSCDFAGCERIYTSFIAMQKHKRLKHTDNSVQKKYVCEQCGATFNQTGNLKYHRRTKHPTEAEQAEKEKSKERFECEVCKKLFHSRYTLKYHTLQLHTNDMKYECNVCGRRMAKKFMLVQHMLVHSTEKMPCEHCGKQFIRKFELEAHIRAVHMKLKPFECQYCSECFASRKTLRHHEYIHTGEKPYVCDICGQAYRQQTCLKNHRKSHEKLSAEALLAANINRTLMNSFLVPSQQPADANINTDTVSLMPTGVGMSATENVMN